MPFRTSGTTVMRIKYYGPVLPTMITVYAGDNAINFYDDGTATKKRPVWFYQF